MNRKHHDALRVSSPGRICLFGEHQDYLQLPVIPLAISLRIAIEGRRSEDRLVHLALPDIGSETSFSLDEPLPYRRERDYFPSAVNVLRRAGFTFSSGFDCVVHGEIPIQAGTSSSSALVVSWVNFLARMSDERRALAPEECARYAHEAEVLEFNEPGGMMDQYTAALGGLLSIEFHPALRIERLASPLGSFVLGDSREPKDTMSILSRVKDRVLAITRRLSERGPEFSLHTIDVEDIGRLDTELGAEESALLSGTLRNRDITKKARELLRRMAPDERSIPLDDRALDDRAPAPHDRKLPPDGHALGALLNEHQAVLRDILGVSTPKIDRMIDAALRAGAYGGKITGSGGGGCMFVYAPEHAREIALAIQEAGGTAYIVQTDTGTRIEPIEVMK
jgi:galactokinase